MDTKVYVSTYNKYNNGTLKGDWINTSDFLDKDSFISECNELHKDEEYPELMFQSVPDSLRSFITESHVKEELWRYLEFIEDLSDDQITFIEQTVDDLSTVDFDELIMPEEYNSDGDLVYKYLEDILQNSSKETINTIYNLVNNQDVISHLGDLDYDIVRIGGKIYSNYI